MTLISVKNLLLLRGGKLLHPPICLDLAPHRLLLLCGANGCGKTTFLYYLAGILESNTIERHRSSFFLPYESGLYPNWTVKENLLHFAKLLKNESQIDEAIDYFGLWELLEKKVSDLSSGQRQRTSLARLFFVRERTWLLDEPEKGLDDFFLKKLRNLVKAHIHRGQAAVIATHMPQGWTSGQVFHLQNAEKEAA